MKHLLNKTFFVCVCCIVYVEYLKNRSFPVFSFPVSYPLTSKYFVFWKTCVNPIRTKLEWVPRDNCSGLTDKTFHEPRGSGMTIKQDNTTGQHRYKLDWAGSKQKKKLLFCYASHQKHDGRLKAHDLTHHEWTLVYTAEKWRELRPTRSKQTPPPDKEKAFFFSSRRNAWAHTSKLPRGVVSYLLVCPFYSSSDSYALKAPFSTK